MTVVLDKLTEVQTQIIDTISLIKDPAVKGVSSVVDFVTDKLPEIPALSFGKEIPTPVELINNQYKFAKSILDTNKDIATAVAKAAAPVTDKVLDRKAAARPVARKTTATKAA